MTFDDEQLQPLYDRLLAHPVTNQHLSAADIRLDGKDLEPDTLIEIDGLPDLGVVEFAHLFSIFNGSRVHQQVENTLGPDGAPPGLYFTTIQPEIIQHPHKNKFGLIREEAGAGIFINDIALFIDHFFLANGAPELLGTIAIALCAITAYRAGLKKIELIAAGGKGYCDHFAGYKVWPKLGFNAPVEAEELAEAPQLAGCTTVQQIVNKDAEWWNQNGSQRLMAFDLMPGSASWTKLLSYIYSKLDAEVNP